MTIVVDASALVLTVTDALPGAADLWARIQRHEVHAPHLVDADLGNAFRGLVLGRKLTAAAGAGHLRRALDAVDERHAHQPLVRRAWEMRNDATFYDALWMALAERLSVPLITADTRLLDLPKLRATVEILR